MCAAIVPVPAQASDFAGMIIVPIVGLILLPWALLNAVLMAAYAYKKRYRSSAFAWTHCGVYVAVPVLAELALLAILPSRPGHAHAFEHAYMVQVVLAVSLLGLIPSLIYLFMGRRKAPDNNS